MFRKVIFLKFNHFQTLLNFFSLSQMLSESSDRKANQLECSKMI